MNCIGFEFFLWRMLIMAKSSEWFAQLFAEASKKSDHEFGRLQVAVRGAIKGGESSSEYIRNQFDYNSDLPSGIKDKTKKEFFNAVYSGVVREMREGVMFSAMNKAWGVGLNGISGLKTYLMKYAEMTERGTDEIKVMVTNKADQKLLASRGIHKGKGNTYLMTDVQLIRFIGGKIGLDLLVEPPTPEANAIADKIADQILSDAPADSVITVEFTDEEMKMIEGCDLTYEREGNKVSATVENAQLIGDWICERFTEPSLDMKFADEYERKLVKLVPCRNARLATFGVEDDTDYDAL